jgi:hypothetical protein
MASELDIANIALGHIGDAATVASFDPPEGSAQAEHCARFYPIARDSLLEMHPWGFATRRIVLPELVATVPAWEHCYAQPNDAISLLAVLPPGTTNDFTQGTYVPQDFVSEVDDLGNAVIYTDQEEATLRYIYRVTDTGRFSSLFTLTLTWHLASMLAGPVWKGDAGAAEAKRCAAMMEHWLGKAASADANQQQVTVEQVVPWVGGR